MRLDLRLLEVFCSVYEEGGISKAAGKLYLSQPTVSGHIRNLEEQLEIKLFDRLPKGIVPTPAGRLLYRHGRAILAEREAAIQSLKQFPNRIEGTLKVSASTIPGEYLLPTIIAEFRHKFPSVTAVLNISDSLSVCKEVLSGESELGFVGVKLDVAGLHFRAFARDELALIVPAERRWEGVESTALATVRQMPFLARETGSGTRMSFEKNIGFSLEDFNIVASLGSTNAVKEAVKAGLGVSVLSLIAVRSEIQRGELKSIAIEGVRSVPRDIFAVSHRQLTMSPLASIFLEFAIANSSSHERSA